MQGEEEKDGHPELNVLEMVIRIYDTISQLGLRIGEDGLIFF